MGLKHFKMSEFRCRCCGEALMDLEFIKRLDLLRSKFCKPLVVTSGFRCPQHNKRSGGSEFSQHLLGLAADLSWSEYGGNERLRLLKLAIDLGFKGIGFHEKFIHLDLRKSPSVMWLY